MSQVRTRPLAPKLAVMSKKDEARYMRTFEDADFCWGCGKANDGTIVGAHLNSVGMGSGTGVKTRGAIAPLCDGCHGMLDGRYSNWPGWAQTRREIIYRIAQKALQQIALTWIEEQR